MTPLELANELLVGLSEAWAADLEDIPTDQRWAQYGTPQATCASLIVAVTALQERPLDQGNQACGFLEIATITIAITRNCGIDSFTEGEQAGMTDPAAVTVISAQIEKDRAKLREIRTEMSKLVDPGTLPQYAFMIQGGLMGTSLTMSVRVM